MVIGTAGLWPAHDHVSAFTCAGGPEARGPEDHDEPLQPAYFFRLMFQNTVAGATIMPSMSARSAIGWYHSPR
jgi:hypothetical protein